MSMMQTVQLSITDGAYAAAVREAVSKRIANGFTQFRATNEVSALVGLVRPAAVGIPVPIVDGLGRMKAIADRSPACRQSDFHGFGRVDLVDRVARLNVNRGRESVIGVKGVNDLCSVYSGDCWNDGRRTCILIRQNNCASKMGKHRRRSRADGDS